MTGERNLSITISYDGIRSHDVVRGVEGSAEKLLETAERVKATYPRLPLSLKLTVTDDNHAEIYDTALQCKELGIPFRAKILEKLKCHQSRFPAEIEGPAYSDETKESIIRQVRQVLDLGIETNRSYLTSLLTKFSGAVSSCKCSEKVLFLGVDGKVFLCRKKDPIGNVFQSSFGEIWRSELKRKRVADMRACPSQEQEMSYTHH